MHACAHAACVRAIALVPRACSCVLVDIWTVPASASLLRLSSVAKMIILSTPTPSSASRNCVPLKVCVHSPSKCRQRRERDRARRATQVTEEREARLLQLSASQRERLAAESAEEREARLQSRRERLAAETAEEREARLQSRRERLAAETAEEREARLLQLSASQRERLAAKTAEERETRLLQLSASQRERLAAETAEEREARQLQWSASRRERLAAESAEEREARLQCDRQRHREQVVVQSQLPLFQQHSVRSKMLRFHAHMASLDSPQCTTCSESYPGLRLGSQSTVCQRCTQDKHTPKLYSTANSMNLEN